MRAGYITINMLMLSNEGMYTRYIFHNSLQKKIERECVLCLLPALSTETPKKKIFQNINTVNRNILVSFKIYIFIFVNMNYDENIKIKMGT